MSAVLRAYGAEFDVDAFLIGCRLPICTVKRRGEAAYPVSKPDGPRHEWSGIHVVISDADFDKFPQQVQESIAFLRSQKEQLRRLCEFRGVTDVTLDFGLERRDVVVQCDHLPAELVALAGELRFGIELTQYPRSDESAVETQES